MCQKCTEHWKKYKAAERDFQEAKEAYLIQCKLNCDEKKDLPPEEPEIVLTEEQRILYEHGFLESQNKPGLFFKQIGIKDNTTIYIDLRKGSPQTYAFKDNGTVEREVIHQNTRAAVNAIRMLTAKESGQTELDMEKT